jgi:hypothetical protein
MAERVMPSKPRCQAKRKDGRRCTYPTREGRKFCGHHRGYKAAPPRARGGVAAALKKGATAAGTALTLVELVEKAITYYPTVIRVIDDFLVAARGGLAFYRLGMVYIPTMEVAHTDRDWSVDREKRIRAEAKRLHAACHRILRHADAQPDRSRLNAEELVVVRRIRDAAQAVTS